MGIWKYEADHDKQPAPEPCCQHLVSVCPLPPATFSTSSHFSVRRQFFTNPFLTDILGTKHSKYQHHSNLRKTSVLLKYPACITVSISIDFSSAFHSVVHEEWTSVFTLWWLLWSLTTMVFTKRKLVNSVLTCRILNFQQVFLSCSLSKMI